MQTNFYRKILVISFLFSVAIFSMVFVSCKDDYIFDDGDRPDFLGSSIYDYMEKDGNFTYFVRLINDLNYAEVLSKTGSKTLFPVKDDVFQRFFDGTNLYGVKSYEELTPAQKRCIMNASMVNMSFTSQMLPNTYGGGSVGEGLALRRNPSSSFLDSLSFINDEVLFANSYWERFSGKGLYLVDNEKVAPVVHFTLPNMNTRGITSEDFSIIYNGMQYNFQSNNGKGDIYINGIKVIERDIICQNGYIHVLDDLLIPAKNMAQVIRDNGQTALFNKLLDKFCMPVPGTSVTINGQTVSNMVYNYYNGSSSDRPLIMDSIFVKRYFNELNFSSDDKGNTLTSYGLLYYDPTDNAYTSGSLEQDMGVMFVPTDQAMNDYLNSSKGRYLKDAYGTWDNIPTSILVLFLKNHQKKSFLTALPHTWSQMNDESSFYMNVTKDDIVKSYQANNGIVYVSKSVYPPVDYQCVYGSVLTSDYTKVMNWGIQDQRMKFKLYLRSMENMYNLIIPVDDAFQNYRDPVSWAKGVAYRQIWSFYYVPERNLVYADLYQATASGEKGTFIKTLGDDDKLEANGQISDENYSKSEQYLIHNRLRDIIDMHIVVGEMTGQAMSGYVDDGKTPYELTKGNSTLKITGVDDNVKMTGGGDIEQNAAPASIVKDASISGRYDSDNGRTYFIDKVIQDPVKSVYMIMGDHPEYKAFFDLLKGDDRVFTYFQNDQDIVPVFSLKRMSSASGMGMVVNSFNNFRYSVFIPTEAALNQAFAEDPNLYTWDEIANEENYDIKKVQTLYLLNFLKNHFMDNSVYINGISFSNKVYDTAAPDPDGKFHKLSLSSSGSNLVVRNVIKDAYGKDIPGSIQANVITSDTNLFNLMGRDYIVDNSDYLSANNIVSSSRSVIHLIDKALKIE